MLDGEIKAGDTVPLIDNEFKGKPLELDGEAVAYADHAFYIIGSHGHPRDKQRKLDPVHDGDEIRAKIAASSQLVRIRVNARNGRMLTKDDVIDIKVSTALRSIIAANEVLKRFVDRRLDNNGLTIEGLAIVGGRLFVGLRRPSLDHGQTPVLSVKLQSLFEGGVAAMADEGTCFIHCPPGYAPRPRDTGWFAGSAPPPAPRPTRYRSAPTRGTKR